MRILSLSQAGFNNQFPFPRLQYRGVLNVNPIREASRLGASSERHCRRPVFLLDGVTYSLDIMTGPANHRIFDIEFNKEGHAIIIIAHRLD